MKSEGLARGTVQLVPYSSQWPLAYAREATAIKEKLGPLNVIDIQHVGSTAIPGILSKPIIDIAIPVSDLTVAERFAPVLAEFGYWYKGRQPDMPNRRFFAKGSENNRTIYLHLANEEEYKNLLKFRDTLRANKQLAEQYSQLKEKLAKDHPTNREKYTKAKDDFIKDVLALP